MLIACLFTVFMTLKTFVSKYLQNALIEFVQTLPQQRKLREVKVQVKLPQAISEKNP